MDIIGNQAILTPTEQTKCCISSPYDIGRECIERFREAESRADELNRELVGQPIDSQRASIRTELTNEFMKMNLFRRMTEHYLRSPLEQEAAGFDG